MEKHYFELPKGLGIKNPLDGMELNFNKKDENRDLWMLHGNLAKKGYDWWWHNLTAIDEETGEEKPFFIEFFTINPEYGGSEPVFGQLKSNRNSGKKPSYLMIKAGTWGKDKAELHRFFGWDEVDIKEEIPFQISAKNCFLSETRTLGRVCVTKEESETHPEYMSDAGEMFWDLKIDKKIAFNVGYGASKALREIDAFEMFWHAQGMKTAYSGEIIYNGRKYKVDPDKCYGYADKNWGSDFTSPWVWLSSNHLISNVTGEELKDSVFDIGGGRPKVGPLSMEGSILGAIWHEGEAFEFNFSKFWTLTKTKFKYKESRDKIIWKLLMETPVAKMTAVVTCNKEDMLKIHYESPDGEMKHKNLWNGGTGTGQIKLFKKKISIKNKWEWELVDDMKALNVGCEYGVYDKPEKNKEKK
jgi:tocopherol cyclase